MIFAFMFGDDAASFVITMLITLFAVVPALVLHELAHGLVALWNGDPTAKFSGRLTLNPLKHLDPVGFIMMMLVGFGYAKPVPVNPYNFKKFRRGLITVSAAGIIMNVLVAFVSSFFSVLFAFASARVGSGAGYWILFYLSQYFWILMTVNLTLAFFNILPFYPLDGFKLIESLTHQGNRFVRFMRNNGQYILWGLMGLSFIVSMAENYASLPYWFSYIDILGTYINYCSSHVGLGFTLLWGLMFPV